jgi:hypothetical protein
MARDGFTADPDRLRDVGQIDLPDLAETLRSARAALQDTEDSWASAFREDRTPMGSMYSDVADDWSSTCWSFVAVLSESADRIDRAGEALVTIADDYQAGDAGTAGVLDGVFDLYDEDPGS